MQHGEGQALALRERAAFFSPLPEGIGPTVVREHLLPNGSGSGDPELQRGCGLLAKRWRGTGPRPTVKYRFFQEKERRFSRSASDGEGQALALR